jgi:hypothetical protein
MFIKINISIQHVLSFTLDFGPVHDRSHSRRLDNSSHNKYNFHSNINNNDHNDDGR